MRYPGDVHLNWLNKSYTLPLSLTVFLLFLIIILMFHVLHYFENLKQSFLNWKQKHKEMRFGKDLEKALKGLVDFGLKKNNEMKPLTPSLEPLRHFCMPNSWESIQYLCHHPIMAPIGWRYAADYDLKREAFAEAYENLLKLKEDVRYVRLRLANQGVALSNLNMSDAQLGFEMFLRKESLKEAFKKIPHFIPLSLLLKEESFLLETYKRNPHRSLAKAWEELDPVKRFQILESMTPKDHPEGCYVLAKEAEKAGLLGEASHYHLHAKEQGHWTCTTCYHVRESMWPWCERCHAIDSFTWQ